MTGSFYVALATALVRGPLRFLSSGTIILKSLASSRAFRYVESPRDAATVTNRVPVQPNISLASFTES
jgi:hypothetical protein